MKKFLCILFFSIFLLSTANAKGLSYNKQDSLINSGSISKGMDCNSLTRILGKPDDLSWLWLGNNKGEYGHYVIMEVYSRDTNKIHYLCEEKRLANKESDSALEVLKDHDLIHIYYDPSEMFKKIFAITSEGSTKYILSKLTLSDYNISRVDLIRALAESKKEQIEKPEETKIVKKKEKEKEKKKAKITEGSQDKEGPIIKIAAKQSFSESSYVLKGSVKDKGSKKIYIEVDGNLIPVKKDGKFSIPRFSPTNEEVEIVAIDQWGNRSTKIVKVKIKIKDTEVAKLEILNPANIKPQSSNNKVALIIGIEKYESTVPAVFAKNDAKWFYEYVKQAFGVKPSNIKLLIDNDTTLVKTYSAIELKQSDRDRITEYVQNMVNKEIVLETEVDTSILGGLVIRVGDKLLDGSTKSKLLSLKNELESASMRSGNSKRNEEART